MDHEDEIEQLDDTIKKVNTTFPQRKPSHEFLNHLIFPELETLCNLFLSQG